MCNVCYSPLITCKKKTFKLKGRERGKGKEKEKENLQQ
nr:unnamed protein product [Brassica rapa]